MTVKKVDATNPNLALPGARFLVQNANGTFSQEVVTGSDGTVTLTNLEASTYSVTELIRRIITKSTMPALSMSFCPALLVKRQQL